MTAALPRGWRVLVDEPPCTGVEQMARDEALLDLAVSSGAPCLRLYGWAPACISFGAHEAALRRFDPALVTAAGLDAVRRPTGGRAVLHRDDLTYAVALPLRMAPELTALLDAVHAVFADALRLLGATALPAPRRRAPAPDGGGICFDAAVGGELVLPAGTVLGSAQRRTAHGVLQHGSLLLTDDQRMLASLLRTTGDAPSDAAGAATLSAALGRAVPFHEAADALRSAWTRATGPIEPLDRAALLAAAAPHRTRFADAAWTWRR